MLRHKPRNCIPWLLAEAAKLSWVVAWAFFILLEREEAMNDQRSYRRLILDTAYPILYFPFSSGLIKRNLDLIGQMGWEGFLTVCSEIIQHLINFESL